MASVFLDKKSFYILQRKRKRTTTLTCSLLKLNHDDKMGDVSLLLHTNVQAASIGHTTLA